jgi:hypothetical protein
MIIKVVVYEILKYLSFVCESKGVWWEVEHPFIHNMDGTWKAIFETFFNIVAHFQLAFNLSKVGALTFFPFKKNNKNVSQPIL